MFHYLLEDTCLFPLRKFVKRKYKVQECNCNVKPYHKSTNIQDMERVSIDKKVEEK